MSAKGTKVRQLTNTPGDDSSPDWSPDGSRIAFHSNRTKGGDYEIYVVNSDGTDLKRLTKVRHGIDNTNPVWSPDGHKIAFTQNRNHHQDVLVMDSAGNHVRRLTHDSFYDAFPTWSPDGKEIAFMSCRPLHSGCEAKIAENIWTISSNGQGHPRRLTNTPSVNEFAPRWSKNRIVFFGERKNSPSTDELYIINADGTGLTRLTHNRWLDAAPAWSGDGTRIVFYSNRDGDDEIYWMQAKRNTTAHQLTHNSLSDQFPAWSPIGSSNP
jgi:TolB protein